MSRAHNHYYKDVRHLEYVDVYRVLKLFGVSDPCVQHAVKKLLCAGGRGAKDTIKDYSEAVDSINRAMEMADEDCAQGVRYPQPSPEATKAITVALEVKVDPAAALLAEAVKILQKIEDATIAVGDLSVRIESRALLRRIENADYKPGVFRLDSNEAAVAQGVDFATHPEAFLGNEQYEPACAAIERPISTVHYESEKHGH